MILLEIRDEAQLDVVQAVEWYEERRDDLGREFIFELDAVLSRVSDNPFQFAPVHEDVRRAMLHQFPYAVYFRVIGETADVLAVLHLRRSPRAWKRRLS